MQILAHSINKTLRTLQRHTHQHRSTDRTTCLLQRHTHSLEMTAGRPGSTAREERKLRKPLIERKRRERINHCLEQLKETVVGAFRLDQSKLEKADILEMTVQHLQNIQSSKVSEEILDSDAQQRYSTGYIQCMHEVHNLLLSCDWMDKTLGSRLLNHLLKSLPRSAAECSRRSKSDQADCASYHGTEADGRRSCPASPAVGMRASATAKSYSAPPLSGPQPTEIPQLTALEMWRPW